MNKKEMFAQAKVEDWETYSETKSDFAKLKIVGYVFLVGTWILILTFTVF